LGEDENRIIGGSDTEPNIFRWMALLEINKTLSCSASIISRNYLLTAAHCLDKQDKGSKLKKERKKKDPEPIRHKKCTPGVCWET